MTPSEAELAKADGITATAHKWISKIELDWERQLGSGRDFFRVTGLENEVQEVQRIVVHYFLKLGYGFQMETYMGSYDDHRGYCLRIQPSPEHKHERGIFSRLFIRLFGGEGA